MCKYQLNPFFLPPLPEPLYNDKISKWLIVPNHWNKNLSRSLLSCSLQVLLWLLKSAMMAFTDQKA